MQAASHPPIETLLQQAAAHPARIPEVLRVQMPLQIIMLGHPPINNFTGVMTCRVCFDARSPSWFWHREF